jgi:hypothetical protein
MGLQAGATQQLHSMWLPGSLSIRQTFEDAVDFLSAMSLLDPTSSRAGDEGM